MAFRVRAREAEIFRAILPQPIASYINTSHRRAIGTENWDGCEFFGESAYDVLGVSEKSSFAEIKASFRKLAKETHPDVSHSPGDAAASRRFLQILAAYEILSDSKKRAHYDGYLFSQRKVLEKYPATGSVLFMHTLSTTMMKQSEVVEWVKWYRLVIDDILTEKKVAVGSGYFDRLENELYAAIRTAYYGPLIDSMDFLPDCFEAEVRSAYETCEVLHLVSGRDLFGMVSLVDRVPELSEMHHKKLTSFNSMESGISHDVRQTNMELSSRSSEALGNHDMQARKDSTSISDVYKELELHVFGKVVATATRSPPQCKSSGMLAADLEDQISVFLNVDEDKVQHVEAASADPASSSVVGSGILLGTITGLGSNAEEGICSVYDPSGRKTHVIMKHRTLLVKHMHWYQVGDEVSACECRCSRARLPPSKFWLFEPRSCVHDIGGWYVETFGRNKKGRTAPSQRQWDCTVGQPEKRLHPAMYLLALAYRTLDLEDTRIRKQTVRDFVGLKLHCALRWCKKLL